jgi:hypothetical protein
MKRGVSRSSRTLGAGCDGRLGATDERVLSGRRSRVVLTPRRWRQLAMMWRCRPFGPTRRHHAGMVARKPGSPGRARKNPLKPIAQGVPALSGEPVVTTLVCFLYLHAGLRVRLTRPAFPAPSVFPRDMMRQNPDMKCRGKAKPRLIDRRRPGQANGSRECAPEDRLRAIRDP